jgi:hypothetical protein
MARRAATLEDIPENAFINILWHLTPEEVTKVSATCRRFHRYANSPALWKRFCDAFGAIPPAPSEIDGDSKAARAQAASPGEVPYKYAVVEFLDLPPQGYGMTADTANYGKIVVGSKVLIKKHREVNGSANWNSTMEQYVGKVAVVTRLSGVDSQGCPGLRVTIDGKSVQYFFRVRDVRLLSRK